MPGRIRPDSLPRTILVWGRLFFFHPLRLVVIAARRIVHIVNALAPAWLLARGSISGGPARLHELLTVRNVVECILGSACTRFCSRRQRLIIPQDPEFLAIRDVNQVARFVLESVSDPGET